MAQNDRDIRLGQVQLIYFPVGDRLLEQPVVTPKIDKNALRIPDVRRHHKTLSLNQFISLTPVL